jgi:hypothetical protein
MKTHCKNGHELTTENTIIRSDRNNSRECRTCQRDGVVRFKTAKPLYDTWKTMIRRCADDAFTDWHLYGGKGIRVCERWMNYENFVADMGNRPVGSTLERNDSNKDYEPSNCRWATAKEQARNTSRNHRILHDGKNLTIAEWAELYGLKYLTLFMRLKRGWSIEKALDSRLIPLEERGVIASRDDKGRIAKAP